MTDRERDAAALDAVLCDVARGGCGWRWKAPIAQ